MEDTKVVSSRARALAYLNLYSRHAPIQTHTDPCRLSWNSRMALSRGTTQEDNAPSEHFGFQSHRRINPLPSPFLSLPRFHRFPLSPSFAAFGFLSTRRIIMFPVLIPRLRFSLHKRIDLATSSLANPSFLGEEFLLRVPSLETNHTALLLGSLKKFIRSSKNLGLFATQKD